jgi:glycosyltransferase involved in cell wall biosynthesis
MKVLHVTPHLGGGVGKAHAALASVLSGAAEQTFLLLEAPRDRRFIELIEASGARVVVARQLDEVAKLAGAADIVQFEFWNHPRLFECLARCAFPPMRCVFWSHVSGIAAPVIQPGLIEQAGRFVFTTEASHGGRSAVAVPPQARATIRTINSGFGFSGVARRTPRHDRGLPPIAYLGTVDFVKMHPGFFDAVDLLKGHVSVCIWGELDRPGAVAGRAAAMRHPERIRFCGPSADPAAALSEADIFFYPLRRDHYGTAENALVEAMSLGLAPVVLDNPAELAIVRHGETGLVGTSIADCAACLQTLLRSPGVRQRIGRNAARDVAAFRTPQRSARAFVELWEELLREPARPTDFRRAIGDTPAEWFLATQRLPGESWAASPPDAAEFAKGTLPHFVSAFPGDASLTQLTQTAAGAALRP